MEEQATNIEMREGNIWRRISRYAWQSVAMLVCLSLLVGGIYPLFITGIGQAAFHHKANGSLISQGGAVIGSLLIGQPFTDAGYFWSRPSAASGGSYNANGSGGSNLGPTNPALLELIADRIAALRAADPGNEQPVPIDLVTASASGLDPDISPAAAAYQIARVARARGLQQATVEALVQKYTRGRQFGFLGEPRVNVLELNLALDAVKRAPTK